MAHAMGEQQAGQDHTPVRPVSPVATSPVTATLCFSPSEMEVFAALSGDRNPLHLDDGFARARGFAGRVVYGGLLLAAVSRLLGEELPGHGCVWHSVKVDFRGPLYVDEQATLTGTLEQENPELGTFKIALRVVAGARTVLKGEALALRPSVRNEDNAP